jgi:transcriptional regulator with XRE-family HTH domain
VVTRQRRAARGLTQLELAERAGVSLQYVTQMESPTAQPNLTLRALSSVAAALGCELHDLLQPAGQPSRRPVGRPSSFTLVALAAERPDSDYVKQPTSGVHPPTRKARKPRSRG